MVRCHASAVQLPPRAGTVAPQRRQGEPRNLRRVPGSGVTGSRGYRCGTRRKAALRLALSAVTGAAAAVLTPALMRQWALAAAEALAEHAQQINDLNVFPVPDADTGTNSSLTFQAGLDAVDDLPADADLVTIEIGRAHV